MASNLDETLDSKRILLSLERYKKALKAVKPPANMTDARIALAYMTFLVDQLVLLIKLVERRKNEKPSNQNAILNTENEFLKELLFHLAVSDQNPDIAINILKTKMAITAENPNNNLSTGQNQNSLLTLINMKNQLITALKDEISEPEKKWNKVKVIAGIIAALLFFTAIIMFVATHSYTLPYIIIMATFAATGTLALLIGLPFKSGQLSLLDYIFFNPSAKQIQRCIDDINYPMFERKNYCKDIANITDNLSQISGIFAQKPSESDKSLHEIVEDQYQNFLLPLG